MRANALHLIGLCSVAIAQPLYSLMSRNGEFFVSYRMQFGHLIELVLLLGLGLPLVLIVAEGIVRLINRRLGQGFHNVLFLLLISLSIFPFFKKSPFLQAHDGIFLTASLIAGIVITLCYVRAKVVYDSFAIMLLATLVFPLVFLFSPDIRKIMLPGKSFVSVDVKVDNPPHIIFIQFDEFKLSALLDKNLTIDPVRFPNFAKLIQTAYWFPRATSTHFDTLISIPSILSSRYPESDHRMPIASEYPNNLFTMLSKNYDLRVQETLTRVFPDSLKNLISQDATLSKVNWGMLLSDLSVIYLHVMLPEHLRSKLPSIDTKWNGFRVMNASPTDAKEKAGDAGVTGGAAVEEGKNQSQSGVWTEVDQEWSVKLPQNYRRSYLENFLTGIKASDKPTLNFIHILLPHSQYEFLPSGKLFAPPLLDLGKDDTGVWFSQSAADVAFQAYLLQIGYCDHFVGQLVEHLKQQGIYDNSMIIMTADHGVSFKEGVPYRFLTTKNCSDILPVPLIIKLPHQQVGVRNEILAETTDILPTVADVLGVKVPWTIDGHSLFDKNFPDRKIKKVSRHDYDYKEITSLPGLQRQFDLFGCDTPLKDLVVQAGHKEMLGRSEKDYPIVKLDNGSIEINQSGIMKKGIDLAGDYIPLYLTGGILSDKPVTENVEVAISVNGVIRAITYATEQFSDRRRFRAVLPESAIQDGSNIVRAFRVEQLPGGGLRLRGSAETTRYALTLNGPNQAGWITSGDQKYSIRPNRLEGSLQPFLYKDNFVELHCWAVDETLHKPAARMLLFLNGEYFATFKGEDRPDIAKWKGEAYLQCGGYMYFPQEMLEGRELSLYAISNDGTASELNYLVSPGEKILFYGGARIEESDPQNPALQIAKDKNIPIRATETAGAVEKLEDGNGCLTMKGWALDPESKKTPEAVLVFQNGKWLRTARNFNDYIDLQDTGVSTPSLQCGFHFDIVKDSLDKVDTSAPLTLQKNRLRVFGLFADRAVELKMDTSGRSRVSKPYTLTRGADGRETITLLAGRRLAVTRGALRGLLQPLLPQEKLLIFRGWGIDERNKKPVDKVLFFGNGVFAGEATPSIVRQDIASWLGAPYLRSGFEQGFPQEAFINSEISAYLVSGDTVTECEYINQRPGGTTEQNKNRLTYPPDYKPTPTSTTLVILGSTPTPPPAGAAPAAAIVPYTLTQDPQGSDQLVTADGRTIPILRGTLRGLLQPLLPQEKLLIFRGWAINEHDKKPVDRVVIFSNGRFAGEIVPNSERPDIAAWLGPEYLRSGYEQGFPKELFVKTEIRAYCISGPVASECRYINTLADGKTTENEERFFYPPEARPAQTSQTLARAPGTANAPTSGTRPALPEKKYALGRDADGNELLIASDGQQITLQAGALRGVLQPLVPKDKLLILRGWAINETDKKPVERVVFFSNGRFLGEVSPALERPDIADWLGAEYLKSGFEQGFPEEFFVKAEISAYALAGGKASEFRYQNPRPDGKTAENGERLYYPPEARPAPTSATLARAAKAASTPPAPVKQYTLGKTASGGEELTTGGGRKITVEPESVRGLVQQLIPKDRLLIVRGWAINETDKKPADKVVVFSNGQYVGETTPNIERPDIASWLGQAYLKSGFEQGFPVEGFMNAEVSVFVLSGDSASECKYLVPAPEGKMQESMTRIRYPQESPPAAK